MLSIFRGAFGVLEELLEITRIKAMKIVPYLWKILEKMGSNPHPFCIHL
jgi:hypothetical protein